ncbi:copper homeostasis protein CutC [Tenggerimyces flavus]|uniref:Copper homeostasis protein cutC homolog n=1 Tax=Tenggerimyces flavus TaxID=1708749 RepID=A0ABV7Y6P0_9ACTN|nr:copper homeostasis protein CutC [Tenggerimyces flavus]MBM7785211.1 copper homeostasis protein [Tenggerimyces flavus]
MTASGSSANPEPIPDSRALLEIIALGPADAAAAEEGGADRLEVCDAMDQDGLAPDPKTVAAIRRRCGLPMRVMLRLADGFTTSPPELGRLAALAKQYADAGADGFVLGFLSLSTEVDIVATSSLLDGIHHAIGVQLPWTFHRAIDHALESDLAWNVVRDLPGLDAVLTAGSVRGVDTGLDELVRRGRLGDGGLVLAGGGLRAEHVPWLAQAGIRSFHVGSSVRPDSSWKAYVDAKYVRAWRKLVDEEVARAADVPR